MKRRSTAKENGSASRKEKWDQINWYNTDQAIAKYLGVSHTAVRYQREKRGIPPWHGSGGNFHKQRPYKPLTEGMMRRRGLL